MPSQPHSFDRVAGIYRWAEYLALGRLLERTRSQFLPEMAHVRQALVLGDGDGRFAAALLQRAPAVRVHAVDSSAAMLRLLAARCARNGDEGRLTTEQASVLRARPQRQCDLVATHFLLDCLSQTEVEQLTKQLAAQLNAGCRWVVSEFGLPRGRLASLVAAAYIRLLYGVFRVLTGLRVSRLPDPQRALAAAGFRRLRRVERLGGFLYAELWERLPAEDGAPELNHAT